MFRNLREAIRLLWRSPWYSATALSMLAVGAGASTAVFSVVDAVVLRSPFDRPEAIAALQVLTADGGRTNAVPTATFEQVSARLPPPVAAVSRWTMATPILTDIDVPRRARVECVSASMAGILGTPPARGRWFTADEDVPGGPPVGVISHSLWTSSLNADPNVVGGTVRLDGTPITVLGVMPRGFDGALSRAARDLWVPLGQVTATESRYGCRAPGQSVNAVVRLQPGVSLDDGVKALNGALPAGTGEETRFGLTSITEQTIGSYEGLFGALVGAVVALLLIACANVANLGLERLLRRRRDLAVRLALGATPGDVRRQILSEHLLIAAGGAICGVLLAVLLLDGVVAMLPTYLPHTDAITINGRVLGASLACVLLCGLGAGLVSAFQATRERALDGVAGSDRGNTSAGRLARRVLVVSEMALGVMLLVGALLMVQTFLTLRPVNPGFDPSNKVIADIRRPQGVTQEGHRQLLDDVRAELGRVPGVRAVAGSTYVPMGDSIGVREVTFEETQAQVFSGTVTVNYFDVMGIPVRRGRGFTAADGPGQPVAAIVNEAFVRRWMPGREPLGQRVTADGTDATIVGVIADVRASGADLRARPEIYLPVGQADWGTPSFVIHAEPRTVPALPATLRDIVARLRPGQLVDSAEFYESMVASEVVTQRLGAWLFGTFAGIAVLLAAVGLGATLAWSVSQRQREIGVRMALGAPAGHVRGLVLWQTLGLAGGGVVIGLTGAAFATKLLEGWLYGITPLDGQTFAACGALMLAVALLAAYLPTRRATRIDPLMALRSE